MGKIRLVVRNEVDAVQGKKHALQRSGPFLRPEPAVPPSQLRVLRSGSGSVGLPVVEIKSKGFKNAHEFDFEGAQQLRNIEIPRANSN